MGKPSGSVIAIAMMAVVLSACASSAVAPAPSPEVSATPTIGGGLYRDANLGIAFEIPASWEDDAANMPYASCFGCLIVGPPEASPPYGIAIFDTTLDFSGPECGDEFGGCPVIGSFGIRTLRDGDEGMLTIAGLPAAQQRLLHQPPLGLINETGESRLYHEIATGIDTPVGDDLFIVGFYREDDEVGELEVEAAYDALLESLVIEE